MPMTPKTMKMGPRKKIALVAHDNCKADLLEWARYNAGTLSRHDLFGTGTTGGVIAAELGLEMNRLLSGPYGGDQQIGAMIATGELDVLVFFWDPLEPQPHDPDIKALLRIAVLYNIPTACSRATADFILSSPLLAEPYERPLHAPKRHAAAPTERAGEAHALDGQGESTRPMTGS